MAQQQFHVEQHADGDEKQSDQDVAIGADGRFDLMPELRFSEHHAGEESAQGEGQAHGMGGPGGGEHYQQNREKK